MINSRLVQREKRVRQPTDRQVSKLDYQAHELKPERRQLHEVRVETTVLRKVYSTPEVKSYTPFRQSAGYRNYDRQLAILTQEYENHRQGQYYSILQSEQFHSLTHISLPSPRHIYYSRAPPAQHHRRQEASSDTEHGDYSSPKPNSPMPNPEH